jgi:hypothetical protein
VAYYALCAHTYPCSTVHLFHASEYNDSKGTYIAVFVDDLLIIGPSKANISTIKAKLSERFHMTDLSPCKYYLGMEVIRDRQNRALKLSQRSYLEKVPRDFGMWDCNKKHDTPIDAHTKLQRADAEFEPIPRHLALQRHHSLQQMLNKADGSIALLGPHILDLDDQGITSYIECLGDGEEMDEFGEYFFSLSR